MTTSRRARTLAIGQTLRRALRPEGRWAVPAVTMVIVLAMLLPLGLWGAVVRETVITDVAQREADQRSTIARLGGYSVQRELFGAAQSLSLFALGPSVHGAVRNNDRRVLDRRMGALLQGRLGSLGAVLDRKGTVLAAPLAPELVGQDFSHRDYFSGALAVDGPYVSEIFASATAGAPSVVAISVAVRDGSETLGVAVLTLMPADLLATLAPLKHARGRQLVLVDAGSRIVASTDPFLLPQETLELPSAATVLSQQPITFAGKQRIVTSASVPFARWTLYVVDDPSVVLAAQHDLERQLLIGGTAAGLLATLAATGIAWLYATSVRQRREIADREAALQRANEDLAATSRHKSEFLAGMSHELRTPLNAILGFSDLLEEQLGAALSDRQRRYLRNVRDAGQHLLGLINDVLDLAKVEAGRVDLRPEPTTLGALTEPVISATRASADARGLRFRVEVDGRLELSVDIGRVRQILYNLLSNAVKFTPADGEVLFRAGHSERDLRLEVRDTGVGIPADKRDQVFGTFERLHEGRSDAPGTGLGLALTKSLVELHGGAITFESRENEGTTFRVTLPGLVVDGAPGARVLIVEDERRDAELVMAVAASVGLQSEVVLSVAEALAAIRRATPLAVVLDLRLPGERGERVLEAMRADPATSRVPVIVVTVEDDDGNSQLLGADDHLTKPIDRSRLTAWLGRVAARAAGKEDPRAAASS